MECHTEKRSVQRLIAYKAMEVTEAPSVRGERRLFASFIRDFMPKAFTPKLIRNLYASSPSLIVPLASPTGVFAFLEVV